MASMGIYIFNKSMLEQYLIEDAADPESSNDFGKNIIPAMLNNGARMFAYPFEGYWKDVGTVASLWEANMDLLGTEPTFDLYDKNFRIFSRNHAYQAQYIGAEAVVENSLVTEGSEVYGTVINSVLSCGVYVAPGAIVKDSVLMDGVSVQAGATVVNAIIDSATVVGIGAVVGAEPVDGERKVVVIGSGYTVEPGTCIEAGAIVSANKN